MSQLITFFVLLMSISFAPANAESSLEARLAGFLPEVHYGLAAAYDGRDSILLFGAGRGEREVSETKVLKYDVNTEVVEEVLRVPFLRAMGAAGIDRKGNFYYIGGNNWNYSNCLNILRFNSTHPTPVEVASLPVPLNQFSAASDPEGEAIYTFGGYRDHSSTTQIFKFNTQDNVVEEIGDLPQSLYGSSAVWHNGYAYIMGGANSISSTRLTHVLRFDPSTNKVSELAVKPNEVKGVFLASAVSDGHSVYLIGGSLRDRNSTHQITQMNFESDTVTIREMEVANFPEVLLWSTAVYVPKKRAIYTFGGVMHHPSSYETTDRIYKINL